MTQEERIFKTHLVQAMYELIKGADFAEIMSKMEKTDLGSGGISGVLMKSAVQAFAPSLPKLLQRLDTNPEAQRNLAAIMRHLVTAADKDEAEVVWIELKTEVEDQKEGEEESHDARDSEEGANEGTAGSPEPRAEIGGSEQGGDDPDDAIDSGTDPGTDPDGSAREDEARND